MFLREAAVRGFLVEDGVIKGVTTRQGSTYLSQAVVLATGVFLRSEIFVGEDHYPGAPGNQLPSTELSENIVSLGFQVERFRTGTPPRVYRSSINFENLQLVEGEPGAGTFLMSRKLKYRNKSPAT